MPGTAGNVTVTHCKRCGREFDPDPDSPHAKMPGRRFCVVCYRMDQREYSHAYYEAHKGIPKPGRQRQRGSRQSLNEQQDAQDRELMRAWRGEEESKPTGNSDYPHTCEFCSERSGQACGSGHRDYGGAEPENCEYWHPRYRVADVDGEYST